MNIFRAPNLNALSGFIYQKEQLAIVARKAPKEADHFFQYLMQASFGISGKVRQETAEADIRKILHNVIPEKLQSHHFYDAWIADMADVCNSFCMMYGSNAVGFWLGSKRGCRRYHIDNVKLRTLVTYAGVGTEYLPDIGADRRAFEQGKPNEKIIRDPSEIRFINAWDVATFRGGPSGLLHRTPDAALKNPSILMRLDNPSFWDKPSKTNAEYALLR